VSEAEPAAREGSPRLSVAGRAAAACTAGLLAGVAAAALTAALLPASVALPIGLPIGLLVGLPVALWLVGRMLRPTTLTLAALADGLRGFHDRDFSLRLRAGRDDDAGALVRLFNRVSATLHEERRSVRQRELLLQTALDRSPAAILLIGPLDRILYANQESRRLLVGDGPLEGQAFEPVLARCPAPLREAFGAGGDSLFTVEHAAVTETYHLSRRPFLLNRRPHTLVVLRRMTDELGRQEAAIWKKVIRVISHELNNSLAPISSLVHSAETAANTPTQAHRLGEILRTVRERTGHLAAFLEGYARFARLPAPRPQEVDWAALLAGVHALYPFDLDGEIPQGRAYLDPAQIQQVLINLLKNACEASEGAPTVSVRIARTADGGTALQVADRGRGMDEVEMRQALLPFYSTKPAGTGLGLPLCREIVEAHGGKIRLESRTDGGTVVTCLFPGRPPAPARG